VEVQDSRLSHILQAWRNHAAFAKPIGNLARTGFILIDSQVPARWKTRLSAGHSSIVAVSSVVFSEALLGKGDVIVEVIAIYLGGG